MPRGVRPVIGTLTAPWSAYVADSMAEVRLTMNKQGSPQNVVVAFLDGGTVSATWTGRGRGEFRIGGRAADFAAGGDEIVARFRVKEAPLQ